MEPDFLNMGFELGSCHNNDVFGKLAEWIGGGVLLEPVGDLRGDETKILAMGIFW